MTFKHLILAGGVLGLMAIARNVTRKGAGLTQTITPENLAGEMRIVGNFQNRIGRMAAEKSQREAVRGFARRMMDDHARLSQRLETIAVNEGLWMPGVDLDGLRTSLADKLQRAPLSAFDALYLQTQDNAHNDAIALLEGFVAASEAGALKDFAEDALNQLIDHQNHIRDLMTTQPEDALAF
jgi:putative membrane protein